MMALPFHTNMLSLVQNEVATKRHLITRSIRTDFKGSPHREASDCLLRVPIGYPDRPLFELYNELTCAWQTDIIDQLPLTTALAEDIADHLNCSQLGRVMLAALGPRKHIYPHIDEGIVPAHYERYHFVITTGEHCLFIVGQESMIMEPGELFWADVKREHAAVNLGTQERINLIMDIRR